MCKSRRIGLLEWTLTGWQCVWFSCCVCIAVICRVCFFRLQMMTQQSDNVTWDARQIEAVPQNSSPSFILQGIHGKTWTFPRRLHGIPCGILCGIFMLRGQKHMKTPRTLHGFPFRLMQSSWSFYEMMWLCYTWHSAYLLLMVIVDSSPGSTRPAISTRCSSVRCTPQCRYVYPQIYI